MCFMLRTGSGVSGFQPPDGSERNNVWLLIEQPRDRLYCALDLLRLLSLLICFYGVILHRAKVGTIIEKTMINETDWNQFFVRRLFVVCANLACLGALAHALHNVRLLRHGLHRISDAL